MKKPISQSRLRDVAHARFQKSIEVPQRFFQAEAERISEVCLAMARCFHQGGRLLAFGAGNSVTDAQHISVEFVHPVIVGKRALPALALGSDIAATVGVSASSYAQIYARQVQTLGRAGDMALGLDATGNDQAVFAGLAAAAQQKMLTIALTSGDGGQLADAPFVDFVFIVPAADQAVIQETHETLYHILWELVHVFFEHKGLLEPDAS